MIYHVLFYLFIVPFFFFNISATTEIYTLSLHDALPISMQRFLFQTDDRAVLKSYITTDDVLAAQLVIELDRKSSRANSSHQIISYAVFCLKKKNNKK